MPPYKWGSAILLILSLALSLVLAEAACRLMLPPPGFVPRGSDDIPGLWVEHPTRAYTYAKQFSGTIVREDFSIRVRTSALGFRIDEETKRQIGSRPLVLAVGDSFTFGWGVQYEQAWPAQLESILNEGRVSGSGPQVINAGVSGYSPRQIHRLTLDLIQELNPEVVVVGVYPAAVDRLFDPYVLFNGGLVRSSSVPRLRAFRDGYLFSPMYRPWMMAVDFWLDEHWSFGSYLWKELYKARERMSGGAISLLAPVVEKSGSAGGDTIRPLLDELESIRAFVRGKHSRLMVLSIVGQDREGTISRSQRQANDRLLAWCRETGVECVEVLSAFDARSGGAPVFRFKNDLHWSLLAHRVAAEELAKRFGPDAVLAGRP
jgi:hypothetical protein